jgi:hypothetical protein
MYSGETHSLQKPNDDSLIVFHPLKEDPQTAGPRDNNSKRSADMMPA